MRTKDDICLFGHSMLLDFAATGASGSITALRLDDGVRFALEGAVIRAHFFTEPSPAMIERFPSEELAENAFQYLQKFMRRYVFIRRVKNAMKKILGWVIAPLVALLLALSLNIALTRQSDAKAASAQIQTSHSGQALPVSSGLAAAPQRVIPQSAELARAMADGAMAGKFSIRLSKGKEGVFYIFSDPGCSYCRALEPELAKLAKRFTIHLFPVSVIGGRQSAERVSPIMCAGTELRAAAWRELAADRAPVARGCAAGDEAIAANNEIFRAAGLSGTPAIIASNGFTYPESSPNTAAAIAAWAKGAPASQ